MDASWSVEAEAATLNPGDQPYPHERHPCRQTVLTRLAVSQIDHASFTRYCFLDERKYELHNGVVRCCHVGNRKMGAARNLLKRRLLMTAFPKRFNEFLILFAYRRRILGIFSTHGKNWWNITSHIEHRGRFIYYVSLWIHVQPTR